MQKNVISEKEARKLLGKTSDDLTNDELNKLQEDLVTVVRLIIGMYIRSKSDIILSGGQND